MLYSIVLTLKILWYQIGLVVIKKLSLQGKLGALKAKKLRQNYVFKQNVIYTYVYTISRKNDLTAYFISSKV